MANTPSLKQLQIDKASRNMVIAVSIATFVLIFTLVAGNSLLKILSFHNRVISAQSTAVNQLALDLTASKQLVSSYENFNNKSINLLGNPAQGTALNDGLNSKIVLDALPSEYDEPALATSIQSLLSNQGVTINGISNTSTSAPGTTGSSPVAIPLTFDVSGPYQSIQNVINNIEKSILPFQFQSVSLTGSQSDLTLSVTVQTYFQPATSFNITKESIN